MKQILWIGGVRYELREIYGIGQSEGSFDDKDSGKECVICMTEPNNTTVIPCNHMCLCSECAKAVIQELMEIKINTNDR
ncbi:hypothetical protein L1987_14474 [Smallanthus sonchifolius]|uniref:Uncharacterized protein n=1 Tax=Smallanthus sonchifolius TaxID=185202 RepID=A0ACB9J4H0_9ASTR|nr:hypothetical protein L1987_14474 [Smallanthus sonchifolius]